MCDFPSLSPLGTEPFKLLLQKAPQPDEGALCTPLAQILQPSPGPLPQTRISPIILLASPATAFPPHSSVLFHLPVLLPSSWATFDFQMLLFQSLLLWWKL